MFPAALAIPAPIPLALDLTLEFGPVVLLVLLTLLDIGAIAALREGLVSKRAARAAKDDAVRADVIPLSGRLPDAQQAATPPSRAA
jgi:hypothetical protein